MPDPKLTELKKQVASINPHVPQASGSVSLSYSAQKDKIQPPPGYTLQDFNASVVPTNEVPSFIRQGIDMSKVRQVPAHPDSEDDKASIAWVNTGDPYSVAINMPDLYGKPVLNHELTHTFQDTRNPDLGSTFAPVARDASNNQTYSYGGIEGLQKALASKKTIADFTKEQQAEIVKDYKALQDQYLDYASKGGPMADFAKKELYRAHQAYHPFIQQLASMPGQGQPVVMPTGSPAAPGLPDYTVAGLGVVPADPLLGGKSVATPTMGTTKRFANGKIGVWDGHGWRAQK